MEAEAKRACRDVTLQKRGKVNADNDKMRICIEARQAIFNYFEDKDNPDKQVQGKS